MELRTVVLLMSTYSTWESKSIRSSPDNLQASNPSSASTLNSFTDMVQVGGNQLYSSALGQTSTGNPLTKEETNKPYTFTDEEYEEIYPDMEDYEASYITKDRDDLSWRPDPVLQNAMDLDKSVRGAMLTLLSLWMLTMKVINDYN